MKKGLKLLFTFVLIIFSLITVGCSSNKVAEQENKEIISFPIDHFSYGLSSVPGLPIQLTLEGATFLCETEKGSFKYYSDTKRISVNSSEKIYYCPLYIINGSAERSEENSFVDIRIKINNEIIGYAVIKINYEENDYLFRPEILVSNIFVDESGDYRRVDDSYVTKRIKQYHM